MYGFVTSEPYLLGGVLGWSKDNKRASPKDLWLQWTEAEKQNSVLVGNPSVCFYCNVKHHPYVLLPQKNSEKKRKFWNISLFFPFIYTKHFLLYLNTSVLSSVRKKLTQCIWPAKMSWFVQPVWFFGNLGYDFIYQIHIHTWFQKLLVLSPVSPIGRLFPNYSDWRSFCTFQAASINSNFI